MKTRCLGACSTVLVGAVTLWAGLADGQELLHGRISYVSSSGAMIKGSADEAWSYVTTNTLVLPGDTLWADENGMLELEMSGGSFLRMADGSKAEIVQLPPAADIQGWIGSFYVHRLSRSSGDFVFRTPAALVGISRDSEVRIDVMSDGATTVTVRWGNASVGTDIGQPEPVASGRRCFVQPGLLPSVPVPFDRDWKDDFDVWNGERSKLLVLGSRSIPLPMPADSVPMGVVDLAAYGDWVYIDQTPYWQPVVVPDFVPYRSGHWSFVPSCGYVWVGDYPFSYVTSHYGRWMYTPSYGWVWGYTDTWAPAWVASVRYGPDFVWCPLDPWDRPAVYGEAFFDVGGLRISLGASSYCDADTLLLGPCGVYELGPNILPHVSTGDIYIWNLYAGDGRHGDRHQRFDSTALVRDYKPRRVIRGPDMMGPQGVAATQRINTLETSVGRPHFRNASSSSRSVRAVSTPQASDMHPRKVRVASDAMASTTSEISRVERHVRQLPEVKGPNSPRADRPKHEANRRAVDQARTDEGAGKQGESSSERTARDRSVGREPSSRGPEGKRDPAAAAPEAGTRSPRTDPRRSVSTGPEVTVTPPPVSRRAPRAPGDTPSLAAPTPRTMKVPDQGAGRTPSRVVIPERMPAPSPRTTPSRVATISPREEVSGRRDTSREEGIGGPRSIVPRSFPSRAAATAPEPRITVPEVPTLRVPTPTEPRAVMIPSRPVNPRLPDAPQVMRPPAVEFRTPESNAPSSRSMGPRFVDRGEGAPAMTAPRAHAEVPRVIMPKSEAPRFEAPRVESPRVERPSSPVISHDNGPSRSGIADRADRADRSSSDSRSERGRR